MEKEVETDGRGQRCLLCRRPLDERMVGEDGLCGECAASVAEYLAVFKLEEGYNRLAIRHLSEIAEATNRYGKPEGNHGPELLLRVATYYGNAVTRSGSPTSKEEFDAPFVPIVVRESNGVRLVLGSHDYWDLRCPDVQIERRPKGWAIFLHPLGGSDPSGYVYFVDDGRSFVVPETAYGPTSPICLLSSDDVAHEIDLIDEPELGEK